MEFIKGTRIEKLYKETSSDKTKNIIKSLLDALSKNGVEISTGINIINEALEKVKGADTAVERYFTLLDRESIPSKINESLNKIKKTAFYKSNDAFKEKIDGIISIKDNIPLTNVLESVIGSIKSVAWNQEFKTILDDMVNLDDNHKSSKLVIESLDILKSDPNVDYLSDLVKRLEHSLELPEAQIPHYISVSIQEFRNFHPEVDNLLIKLAGVDVRTQSKIQNKITYLGKANLKPVISPVIKKNGSKYLVLENKLYRTKKNQILDANPSDLTPKEIKVFEAFSNVQVIDGCIHFSDGMNNYKIYENPEAAGQPLCTVNDQPFDQTSETEYMEQCATGCDPWSLEIMNILAECFGSIETVENACELESKITPQISCFVIMLDDENSVIMNDEMMNESMVINGKSAIETKNLILESFGVNIDDFLGERLAGYDKKRFDLIKKVIDIKKSKNLILESLNKINEEDEETQKDEDVMSLKSSLQDELNKLSKMESDMETELGESIDIPDDDLEKDPEELVGDELTPRF